MERRSVILALALSFISLVSFAQGYTFKVLANKGANEVMRAGEWTSLKTGASLNDTDELKVSENAYLGLVHSSGKTLELKNAGNHKISELAGQLNTEGSNLASKYADYVLSKMSAEGKKNRLNATGAVSRTLSSETSSSEIKIFVPNSTGVYGSEPVIRWSEVEGDNITYDFVVKSMFEDVLMEIKTSDPQYKLNLQDPRLEGEPAVLLTVKSSNGNDSESKTVALKKLPATDAKKIEMTLKELMVNSEEQNALNSYILAGFYEENNLMADALTSYIRAMELAPEVDSYSEAYEEFLLRNNLGK